MKRFLLFFCFVIILAVFSGCGGNTATVTLSPTASESATITQSLSPTQPASPSPSVAANASVSEYYPIKENVKYDYEGAGNEYAAFTVYVDYTDENMVQLRTDNGGTVTVSVIELSDGRVTKAFSESEVYYRENFLDKTVQPQEVLLMEPIETGTTWTMPDSSVRTITSISAPVDTPSGTYSAVEVTTEFADGSKTYYYYAKDIGLVKYVYKSADMEMEVSSSLSGIEENAELTSGIRFYFPNINDEKLYYTDKEISFRTNDITRELLAQGYKDAATDQFSSVLSKNAKINSLYLNNDGMVYIDLSSEFLTEMNAGAAYEQMILQSIANTFGNYYGSDKVVLTVNNQLYESGHIKLEKGEYLKVDLTNTAPME